MPSSPKLWVLAYDLHHPVHHVPSWDAVLDFLKHNRVDGFLFGGDQNDMAEISHWNKGKPLFQERGALDRNLKAFDRDILSQVERLLPPGAERVWLTGNHDAWCTALFEESPALEGMFSVESHLRLQERHWNVIPQGGHFKLASNLFAIHGDTIGGGQNHSKKAVETYCASVVMGHSHSYQAWTKASPVHMEERWTATVLPCLCNRAPSYGKNRANTWNNGFGIVEVRPGGEFSLYPVTITGGQFSYGSRLYGHRKYKARKAA